ncbi:aspartate kinase [Roseivirga thermotolerans]|uniref:Aspartokinase n=1 Tax=Roseivirga thermotolerans TaxID=1758176 RepID=A0ABQ3I867_9BACT|nr:aspartate kinase [Roseivirga thermotolerans]GHE67027.1 aspartokinase [Roseivirga thermotolerans]
MKVFKFGGASVKDAQSVQNMARIIAAHQNEQLVVVVSAMGKMTNAFEAILAKTIDQEPFEEAIEDVKNFHLSIVKGLEIATQKQLQEDLEEIYEQLVMRLNSYSSATGYDFIYDQTVSLAEVISTKIISAYLTHQGITNEWVDARKVVKTNNTHRQAMVDWGASQAMIKSQVVPLLKDKIVLTQGFIGSNAKYNTTTLGREGSDFSAAIFATCMNAESVTIWKDVPGVLNADPKKFENTKLYERLPYKEAAEMTYYGATVIHPKTIKPLAQKKIPLFVRSFQQVEASGTVIEECQVPNLNPAIIHKDKQTVISFKISDFSFINEHHIYTIFEHIKRLNLSINLMQNSAITFTVCMDDNPKKREQLRTALMEEFNIYYNEGLEMITVKNYNQETINELMQGKQVIIEQRSRNNFQMVYKVN